ncbi:MAG: alpha-galactosidase [Candidatus Hydrogenedentes bacterium]|nr:alpha-galactosidase [Candidatus Hydrogenedentota bacterium]
MRNLSLVFTLVSMLGLAVAMGDPASAEADRAAADRWSAVVFEGKELPVPVIPHLHVEANNDPVQLNARGGKPMRLSDGEHKKGLYCHAYSKVHALNLEDAVKFEAVVGVDSNDNTSGGRGSVEFIVISGEKELYHSAVLKEGMPAVPVSVELGGINELTLVVTDGGDGIACDQSDWAEARVTLRDGSVLWLGDLPMQVSREAYSLETPFSFSYAGASSRDFLADWTLKRSSKKLDKERTQHTLVWTDPKTKLEVRCEGIAYSDFPTVEWTLYFKNGGPGPSPILSDIRAMDVTVYADGPNVTLHHFKGSPCLPTDYEPFEKTFAEKESFSLATAGGRSTNSVLPNFNVSWNGKGLIAVLGWPGQWAAQFTRVVDNGLRIAAGQELTHFSLQPGEEVRSPLAVLQFYSGDWIGAQNVWRRWMLAHNMPQPHGKTPPPEVAACSSHQFAEMIHANTQNQIFFVDRYLEEGIKLDFWWMDAGWYINQSGWPNTGTWEVDEKRFPGGLRVITDHARSKGVRSIVWFEPERVTPGTWLYDTHPEWLLGKDGDQKLLNLGNPDALKWLTDHVNGLIDSQGIDLYRNDFNFDPLGYWRANDAEDRQGITEIRYVEGFLAYWDGLRAKHPDMLIDTCASGGRRNDIETLRRSVPLLRSDFLLEPVSQQLHTYGISFWIPFYGTGVNSTNSYLFRSVMCPHMTYCYDMRNREIDYATLRTLYKQWLNVAPCLLGDYYPLTSYSTEDDQWMAWQFDLPEEGRGMVQVFRRAGSAYESARFPLRGLDEAATYSIVDADTGQSVEYTGKELMEKGVLAACASKPQALLLTYQRNAK